MLISLDCRVMTMIDEYLISFDYIQLLLQIQFVSTFQREPKGSVKPRNNSKECGANKP